MTDTSATRRPRVSAFPKCYLDDLASGKMRLEEWLDMSLELEAEGLEIYVPWLPLDDRDGVRSIRRRIEDSGRECSLVCYSPDFTQPDAARRAEEVERQRRAIDVTVDLGARFCRILSGQRRPEVSRADGIGWTVDGIRESLEHAASCGVTLAMENHFKDGAWRYPEFAQRSDVFLEIIAEIESPFFGVQYDPSNTVVAGEDPIAFLEKVKDRVVSVHASDRFLAPGSTLEDMRQADGTLGYPEFLCHGVTGKGLNDYDAIFRVLRSVEFSDWISIEDGMNGMGEMRESIEFLRRKIDEFYGGD